MNKDKQFIDNLLASEEISEKDLDYIKSRWHDQTFRSYYNLRMESHYKEKPTTTLVKYIPLIIFVLLIIIGIILMK